MRNHLVASAAAVLLGLGFAVAAPPMAAQAQVSINISVGFAPPPLPIYDQPPIPGYGYIWTPGYWAWDDYINDYYWVPGTWVRPPRIGYLWTPPYWGWSSGRYVFNNGYWGPHIGFYGGINYGYGYGGDGYEGGYWRGEQLYYNRSVNNISHANIRSVYDRAVSNNTRYNRIGYFGGAGGVQARPTSQQLAVQREAHVGPTSTQLQHWQTAAKDQGLRASLNRGAPPIAATAQPGTFRGSGVVAANKASATYRPPAAMTQQRRVPAQQQPRPQQLPQARPQQQQPQAQPQARRQQQQQVAQPQQQQAQHQQQPQPQQHQQEARRQQQRPQAQPQQQQAQHQRQAQPQQHQQEARRQQQQQQDRPDKGG